MLHRYKKLHSPCEIRRNLYRLAGDVRRRFNTYSYEVKRPLAIGINQQNVNVMENKHHVCFITSLEYLKG